VLFFLRYGSETVGAPGSEDDDDAESAESFDNEGVSFPSPASGAESFAGKDLVLFTVFRDVPSPSVGVGFEEAFAAWVFGLESVPRTDLECDVSTMVVCCCGCVGYGLVLYVDCRRRCRFRITKAGLRGKVWGY
jgi:hypothetical protein